MDGEGNSRHDGALELLEHVLGDERAEPTHLPLSLLENITKGFSIDHKIGIGGFAVVYKGIVGKGTVAVKKLTKTYDMPESEFHKEIECLMKAKHKNVVRILGYCDDTQGIMENYQGKPVMAGRRNWLLCLEYVPNGSLENYITGASSGLDWKRRYRIIKGICKGLHYLHKNYILHLDLKPANILLDRHLVPKISDFGLSRCLDEGQTPATTKHIRGTPGYLAPELYTGKITFASDIYSLGVIIMEVLAGVKRYPEDENVVQSWMNRLEASEGDTQLEQVKVCIELVIQCLEADPKKRPTARSIIDRLEQMASTHGSDDDIAHASSSTISSVELEVSSSVVVEQQSEETIGKATAESVAIDHIMEENTEQMANRTSSSVEQQSGETSGKKYMAESPERDDYWQENTKQKVNRGGASISSSISTMLHKLNNLAIFNRKPPCRNFDMNAMCALLKSHAIKTFKKEELRPILKSRNLIGRGDFNETYKGLLDNKPVAVKKLIFGDWMQYQQLENEVVIHSEVIHKNIVRLIGCCAEMDTPMIVYEYVSNGSLEDILHHHNNKQPLNLDVRLRIAAESAQALAYMHSQTHTKILHGDVKPANILLDGNFVPKISDFSFSRLITYEKQHTINVIGDLSYIDPVYLETGLLTLKSDVYSFGIVILELISRKRASRSDDHSLVKSFLHVHNKGEKATELFDKEISVTDDLEVLYNLAGIAMECVELDADQRPSMTDVAERLLILKRSRGLQVDWII